MHKSNKRQYGSVSSEEGGTARAQSDLRTGDDNNNKRFGVPSYSELFKIVLDATAMDLRKTKGHNAEDRRVRWTKYKNISMWSDNWGNDLT